VDNKTEQRTSATAYWRDVKKKACQVDGHEFFSKCEKENEDRPSICTDMAREALGLRPPKRYMGSLIEGSGLMSRCGRRGQCRRNSLL